MIAPNVIELATYESWPAFEQVNYLGWILRFAEGCTKRANSANALGPVNSSLPEAVAYCESFYEIRQQPTIFRLLSSVEDPILDSYLAVPSFLRHFRQAGQTRAVEVTLKKSIK